jgi:thiamine biosynthesis lipoprotein
MEPAAARRAADAVTADFHHFHATWHAWQDSALTRINAQLATGQAFSVEPEMIPLLERARALSRASDYLFNPAIGQLFARWGLQSDEPKGPPPDPAVIDALVAQHPTLNDVVIEGNQLRGTNPAAQLDVGAIGQGYAVDVAIAHLRTLGVENAIVNASGDIRVIGKHGTRPWRIGIRNPRGNGIFASIELQGDESIVTSGTYERYFEYGGKRYHHVLDPRTGYPAQGTLSVTVLAHDATTADAASTALLVAGAHDWQRIARAMGVKHVMLIDAQGTAHIDPALTKRIRFEIDPAPEIVISAAL